MKKVVGVVMIMTAGALVVYLRWRGINMTEGQLFLRFWPTWMLVALLIICGGIKLGQ